MYDDYEKKVRLLAANIHDFETINGQICPKCNGGIHHDRDFSITKTPTEIRFICFRAKCGYRGIIRTNSNEPHKPPKQKTGNPYLDYLYKLDTKTKLYLQTRFALYDTSMYRLDKLGRVFIPVIGIEGYQIAWLARTYKELSTYSGPKAVVYWDSVYKLKNDFSFFSGKDTKVYLVEDHISARRIKEVTGADAVALLGVEVTQELVVELYKLGYKDIVVALDANAWNKASTFARKYNLFGVRMITWDSELDPKDMSTEELREAFRVD